MASSSGSRSSRRTRDHDAASSNPVPSRHHTRPSYQPTARLGGCPSPVRVCRLAWACGRGVWMLVAYEAALAYLEGQKEVDFLLSAGGGGHHGGGGHGDHSSAGRDAHAPTPAECSNGGVVRTRRKPKVPKDESSSRFSLGLFQKRSPREGGRRSKVVPPDGSSAGPPSAPASPPEEPADDAAAKSAVSFAPAEVITEPQADAGAGSVEPSSGSPDLISKSLAGCRDSSGSSDGYAVERVSTASLLGPQRLPGHVGWAGAGRGSLRVMVAATMVADDYGGASEPDSASGATPTSPKRPGMLERGTTQYFKNHYNEVKMEHADNVAKVLEIIKEIEERQPALISSIKTRSATFRVLLKQREQIELMLHEGVLVDLDARPMIEDVNGRIKREVPASPARTLPEPSKPQRSRPQRAPTLTVAPSLLRCPRLVRQYLDGFYETLPWTKASRRKNKMMDKSPLIMGLDGTKHRLASMLHQPHLPHLHLPSFCQSSSGSVTPRSSARGALTSSTSPRPGGTTSSAAVHPDPNA